VPNATSQERHQACGIEALLILGSPDLSRQRFSCAGTLSTKEATYSCQQRGPAEVPERGDLRRPCCKRSVIGRAIGR
jgi:hypothetical protein